jgi:adenosylhomocysteine nucleosidase
MPIALVSALTEELQTLLCLLDAPSVDHHAGRAFHRGRLDGHDVVLVLSGIGKVAAATTTTLLIERHEAELIIFTGVAGGLSPTVSIGDVVIARELLQHDLDASPLFPRHEVPLTGRSRFPTDALLSDALAQAARDALEAERIGLAASLAALGITAPKVHEGLVISGDRFVATAIESTALRAELPDALAVEMEGAAVAQVCHDCDTPFAVLRTVSDRADDSAHVDFPRFLGEVAAPLAAAVLRTWLKRRAQLPPIPPQGAG